LEIQIGLLPRTNIHPALVVNGPEIKTGAKFLLPQAGRNRW
jgi:hypothetical protein